MANYQMRITRIALLHTFSNSQTGASFIKPEVGIAMGSLTKDGSHIVTVTGITTDRCSGTGSFSPKPENFFTTQPSHGSVEAGQHDYDANLLPVLCSALVDQHSQRVKLNK